jgi:uncharacterized protein
VAVAWGVTVAVGVCRLSAMTSIWRAVEAGDLAEVERLVGQDPDLLDVRVAGDCTPLILASEGGRVGVVRWLLDKGAAINARALGGFTSLWYACADARLPVVKLLLERGADPTIATAGGGSTPLMVASIQNNLEIVRLILGNPSGKDAIDHLNIHGETALRLACYWGRGGVARALLENGADPTIADNDGITPMAIATQPPDRDRITVEGRRECVAALEVRPLSIFLFLLISRSSDQRAEA